MSEDKDSKPTYDELLKALKSLMPWVGKAIADDAFARCTAPRQANKALATAQAVIVEAEKDNNR